MKVNREKGRYWDEPWNVFTGCTPIQDIANPCGQCWANGFATRLHGADAFKPTFHRERLSQAERWERPRILFCNNTSDWLHSAFSEAQILDFLAALARAPQHIALLLTKRPERLRAIQELWMAGGEDWPDTWWTGVSFWNHESAIRNLRHLLPCEGPHWCSYESMLGWLELEEAIREAQLNVGTDRTLELVTFGAETGVHRRPADPEWFPPVVSDCLRLGIPAWIKAYPTEDGGITHELSEMPEYVRVRQLPEQMEELLRRRAA